MCEGGHPEPSGQGPSSETRGERGEDLSEFDSPGQIRVPPSIWPEPYAAAEKSQLGANPFQPSPLHGLEAAGRSDCFWKQFGFFVINVAGC
jgi:hypothetical protein